MSQRLPKGAGGRVEVGHPDEAVDGVTAAAEPGQPARQQDREPAVAVDVVGQADRPRGHRKDLVVERRHQVAEQPSVDARRVLGRDVDLDPPADRPEHPWTAR